MTDHRKHHDFADEDGDPHTPHGGGPGCSARPRALARPRRLALQLGRPADRRRYGADLLKDRGIRLIDALEKPLILASLAIPFLLGLAIKGTLTGALLTLVWGGLLRIFLLHHATFSINSICHFFGRRRFATDDESDERGLAVAPDLRRVLAQQPPRLPDLGLPRPAPRANSIPEACSSALERLGLAWEVVRISPDRQLRQAVASPQPDHTTRWRPDMKILDALRNRRSRGSGRDTPAADALTRRAGLPISDYDQLGDKQVGDRLSPALSGRAGHGRDL